MQKQVGKCSLGVYSQKSTFLPVFIRRMPRQREICKANFESVGMVHFTRMLERRVNEEFARKFRILRDSRIAFRVALLIVNPADRLGNAYAYSSLSRHSPYELKKQVTVVSKLPLLPVFLIRMVHFNAHSPASPAWYAIPAPHT